MFKLNSKKKTRLTVFLFIAPGLVFVFFLTLYPLGRAIEMSFFEGKVGGGSIFVGFSNYQRSFGDSLFLLSLWHTAYFTAISVSLHYFIGLGLALMLNRLGRGRLSNVLRGFLFLPWLFTSAVWCVTWQLILHPHFSVLNEFLKAIGLGNLARGWLVEPSLLPLTTLGIVNGWKSFPFCMVMLLATMQVIPKELYEVAEIDGASSFRKFVNITWPFLKPTTGVILLVDTIGTFHYFDIVWILTGGGPINKTEVLSTYIYKCAFEQGNFEFSSALSIILMIILIIVMFVYIRRFLKEAIQL